MSQPLGLTTIEDGDDFYPGDEELSQMDFSGVNNLNNAELSSSPPSLRTITPLVSNSDSQNHCAKLSVLDHAHSKFSLRYATTGVVARSCAQHQFVERGLQMGEGDSENSDSESPSSSSSSDTRQRNNTGLCCPRHLRKILPLSLPDPSCYAVKGRELMVYKDYTLAAKHLSKEHDAGVEATLMVAIDEAHALDWLTRETGDGVF